MKSIIATISERTLMLILAAFSLFFMVYSHSLLKEIKELEDRIIRRQAELGRIIFLRNEYLKKKGFSLVPKGGKENKVLTLSHVEQATSKYLKGAKIVLLKPVSLKTGKEATIQAIEIKIQGMVLAEMVSLMEELEKSGLLIRKFQVTVSQPSGSNFLDVYLMVSERT